MSESTKSWLGWLLNIDWSKIPDGSTPKLQFSNVPTGLPATLALLAAIVLFAGLVIFYRREETDISGFRRFSMWACRVCVLALLCVVGIGGLELRAKKTVFKPARFLILVDSSASMSRVDKHLPDLEAKSVGEALGVAPEEVKKIRRYVLASMLLEKNDAALIRALREKAIVEVYRFDAALTEISSLGKIELAEGDGAGTDEAAGSGSHAAWSVPRLKLEKFGRATHLGGAVQELLSRFEGEPISGILVVSDGKITGGPDASDAAAFARARRIPVWSVGFGDPHQPRNIELRSITAPPAVFQSTKDKFQIGAEIFHQGLEGKSVQVILERMQNESATEVETRDVDLGPESDPVVVSFQLLPAKLGRFNYRIRVEPLPEEENTQDNVRTTGVTVKDSWAKVLLVSGSPSFEYRFLRNYLARESNLELHQWLQTASDTWNIGQNRWNWGAARVRKARELNDAGERDKAVELLSKVINAKVPSWIGTAEGLLKRWGASAGSHTAQSEWLTKLELDRAELPDAYDVIILLDPDMREVQRESIDKLREFVEDRGGGLVLCAGEKHTYPMLANPAFSSFLDLLPVVPNLDVAGDRYEVGRLFPVPYKPVLTAEGQSHPLSTFVATAERNKELWEALPPMYYAFPVKRHKPHARVLLRHSNPDESTTDGEPMPVLAVHNYGPGKVLWVGFDETWRWRGQAEPMYHLFWTQLVRYMTTGKLLGGRMRGRFVLQRTEFDVGEQVRIQVTALEPDMATPLASGELLVEISGPKVERTLALRPIRDRPGWFEGEFYAPRAGEYRGHLVGFKAREFEPLVLTVIPARKEFRDPRLDRAALLRLTGVRYGTGSGSEAAGSFGAGSVGAGSVGAGSDVETVAGPLSDGGGLVALADVERLPEVVPDASLVLEEPQPPNRLWASPALWILIMMWLTVEWFLRKLSNLL